MIEVPCFLAAGEGLVFALQRMDAIGAVIFGALIMLSILAWSIMITKFKQVNRAQKSSNLFWNNLRQDKNFLTMYNQELKLEGCPLYEIYVAGCKELTGALPKLEEEPDLLRGGTATLGVMNRINVAELERIKTALERAVAEQAVKLEAQIILLGTSVTAAPFLGLLGTVYGIMEAFAGIGMHGDTNISTLAPGIAGALINTVAGLFVALPSLVGYNVLLGKIRTLTVSMDNFASELVTWIEKGFLKT
jgi:biopolymer transport protein ExbB/TolQ